MPMTAEELATLLRSPSFKPLTPEERERLFYPNSFRLRPSKSRRRVFVQGEEPPPGKAIMTAILDQQAGSTDILFRTSL
jgi:hypothetical protein